MFRLSVHYVWLAACLISSASSAAVGTTTPRVASRAASAAQAAVSVTVDGLTYVNKVCSHKRCVYWHSRILTVFIITSIYYRV